MRAIETCLFIKCFVPVIYIHQRLPIEKQTYSRSINALLQSQALTLAMWMENLLNDITNLNQV